MRSAFAALLAAALASPCAAAPELAVAVSSAAASRPGTVILRVDPQTGTGRYRRPSLGLGRLFDEGKPLEVMMWGGSGAVAGSLAGPAGTIIGAGAGALCGLVYSIFVVPHNGPEPKLPK
jgi:hypothetical protein